MHLPSVKTMGLTMTALLVAAQVIRPARTNPPTDPSATLQARTRITPDVQAVLDRSCRDCHSHDTRWPWYSQVAPVSWIVISHVNEGRDHLSFSNWPVADRGEVDTRLREMCEEVRSGGMPLRSYVLAHPDAALTDADKDALCAWTERERSAIGP